LTIERNERSQNKFEKVIIYLKELKGKQTNQHSKRSFAEQNRQFYIVFLNR
jgi:hypothetical protein